MQRHSIPPEECNQEKLFGGDQVAGWEAEACPSPGVLLKYFWGLCSMSSSFINVVACGPVTLRLWSGCFVWLL